MFSPDFIVFYFNHSVFGVSC